MKRPRAGVFQALVAVSVFVAMAVLLMLRLFTEFYTFLVAALGIWAFWALIDAFKEKRVVRALVFYALSLCGVVGTFGFIYSTTGLLQSNNLAGQETIVKGIKAGMYFSIVTWTNLGYGDLQPLPAIRWVAAFEAVCGYIFMGILVSLLFSLLTKTVYQGNHNQQ